jgi:rod shape-determining protein MreB
LVGVARELAIDFGTAWTRVWTRGKGLVLDEPTVAAVDTRTREVLALGSEAYDLVGRTPHHVVIVRPLRQGAITDFDMAERMLRSILTRCGVSRMSRPKLLLTVPAAATSIERRALKQAARSAGAASAVLLETPMAAAIGLGLPVHDPVGSVVVDIGAGTSETGVISLGGVVALKAQRIGGSDLDVVISEMVRHRFDVVIGDRMSEQLKIAVGSADEHAPQHTAEVSGHKTASGEPAVAEITTADVSGAIADLLRSMVDGVAACIADSPPEFAQDAIFEGIHLVGGGALLDGIVPLLSAGTAVPVNLAENPRYVVIEGAGRCLEDLSRLTSLFKSADR